MSKDVPLLVRFFTKLLFDVLPAGLVSIVGGFVFTHLMHTVMPGSAAAPGAPASAQMMQLVGDEHALMIDFLKARLAAEKRRLAEEDEAARAAATGNPAGAALHRVTVTAEVTRPAGPHGKASRTAPSMPRAPLLIAQTEQQETVEPSRTGPSSLLTKTIELKDHAVGAARQVVTAIGGIPSWIGGIGERISSSSVTSSSTAELLTASVRLDQ